MFNVELNRCEAFSSLNGKNSLLCNINIESCRGREGENIFHAFQTENINFLYAAGPFAALNDQPSVEWCSTRSLGERAHFNIHIQLYPAVKKAFGLR